MSDQKPTKAKSKKAAKPEADKPARPKKARAVKQAAPVEHPQAAPVEPPKAEAQAPVTPEPAKPEQPEFTRKQLRFISEYPIDCNGTQAAIRAGYSAKTACEQAARLLANVKVKAAIEKALAEAGKRNELDQDKVLKMWRGIAEHDTNELVEMRRVCCRHCWGPDFAEMETKAEHAIRKRRYEEEMARWEDSERKRRQPFWDGTIVVGYDARKPINPECPECFGEGEQRVIFKDTRTLSAGAKAAYAGVKIGRDGTEMKIASKTEALDAISRHLGFYEKDNEHSLILMDKEAMQAKFVTKMAASRERQRKIIQERGLADE